MSGAARASASLLSAVGPSEASCRAHDKTRAAAPPSKRVLSLKHLESDSHGNGFVVHPLDAGQEEQTGH